MTFRECSTRPTWTVDKLSAERTLYRVKYSTLYFTWKICRTVLRLSILKNIGNAIGVAKGAPYETSKVLTKTVA